LTLLHLQLFITKTYLQVCLVWAFSSHLTITKYYNTIEMIHNNTQQLTAKNFCKLAPIDVTTLGRWRNKQDWSVLTNVTEKKKGRRTYYKYDRELLKHFLPKHWLDVEVKAVEQEAEIKAMKNLIDRLNNPNTLEYRMFQLDWTVFGTVAFKYDKGKTQCFNDMSKLYEELEQRFGKKTKLRLFYTTEPFANRNGNHTHFILHVSNKILKDEVVMCIENHFKYDRVDAQPYNKYKAGTYYPAKNGLQGTDWDILGNNLTIDGLSNES